MTRFAPADLGELRDAVCEALAAGEPLEVVAGGPKRGLGRPLQLPRTLDLSRLSATCRAWSGAGVPAERAGYDRRRRDPWAAASEFGV